MKKVLYLLLAVAVGFGAAKLMDRCSDDSSDNMSYAEEEYDYYEEGDSALILEEGEEYAGADYALLDSVIDWDFDSVYDPNYQYAVEAVEEEPAKIAIPSNSAKKVNDSKKETIVNNNSVQTSTLEDDEDDSFLSHFVEILQDQTPYYINKFVEIKHISLYYKTLTIVYTVTNGLYHILDETSANTFLRYTFPNDTDNDDLNYYYNKIREELIDDNIIVKLSYINRDKTELKKNYTLINSEIRKAFSN